MSSTVVRPAPPLEAAQALARHLREHPEAAAKSAVELASNFGLEPQFVDEVLRGVQNKPKEARARHTDWHLRASRGAGEAFDLLIRHPIAFVSMITLLYCAYFSQLVFTGKISAFQPTALTTWSFLNVCAIHQACYYRRGQVRYALYGALSFWLLLAGAFVVLIWARASDKTNPELLPTMFAVAAAVMVISLIYGSIGSFFAVLGGYAKIKKEERNESAQSRQELLGRLFDIQEKLRTCHERKEKERRFIPSGLVQTFNRSPYAVAIFGNAGLTLATIFAFHFAGASLDRSQTPTAIVAIVETVTFLLAIVFTAGVGYLAGKFSRACVLTVLSTGLTLPMVLIPVSPFGMQAASQFFDWRDLVLKFVLIVALTAVGSLGAYVEARTLQAQRLLENDPAALLAEMVRLEWRLNVNSNEVCVVVVDAAKSSEMKASSDPLVAEYSFREYQKFLEAICKRNGGCVHSTAGDGAVLSFSRCDQALAAAREIQTGISFFNEHVNRMSAKFRLRVGMHMGSLTGDLEDVQYTEVIDIAAHVEAAAPVRGILMTKCVAENLPNEHLIPLKEPVDGHEVLLAYNPTVDA